MANKQRNWWRETADLNTWYGGAIAVTLFVSLAVIVLYVAGLRRMTSQDVYLVPTPEAGTATVQWQRAQP